MANNRYVDALLKLVLLSAIIHLGVLAVQSFRTGDAALLNYFNILDLDLFFPSVASGSFSQIVSALVVAGLYLVVFSFFTKKKQ